MTPPPGDWNGRGVALLRGINVGGNHLLPMKELAAIFAAEGCRDVCTYIQSGNVIFSAGADALPDLAQRIAKTIHSRFGFSSPVILRSETEFSQVLDGNPYLIAGHDPNALYVYFLADHPLEAHLSQLNPERFAPDRFSIRNREIFAYLPNGMGRSKFTNSSVDSALKTVSTARNWRTVLKLRELLAS